jgi:hypothetical protein
MSDPIIEQLSKFGDYDEQESWQLFRAGFLLKNVSERVADLKNAQAWLETYDKPTKEAASILEKVRLLSDAHFALRRAGR